MKKIVLLITTLSIAVACAIDPHIPSNIWDGVTITEPGVDPTKKYYLIRVPGNLAWLAEQEEITKNIKFVNHQNMGNHPYKGIQKFDGILDGDNKSIRNLNIDTSSGNTPAALIKEVTGNLTMQRLTLEGGKITGKTNAAAFIGTATGQENGQLTIILDNLSTNYTLTSDDGNVGGLIASVTYSDVTITNSKNLGTIVTKTTSIESSIGGAIGSITNSDINISNYENTLTLSTGGNVGGIIGKSSENVIIGDNLTNSGAINSVGGSAGGIIGTSIDTGLTTNNLTNSGVITSNTKSAGGIIGESTGSIGSEMTNANNTGNITGYNGSVGGIIGLLNGSARNMMTNIKSTGIINNDNGSVGGIIGESLNSNTTTDNVTNTGKITRTGTNETAIGSAGGIIGSNIGGTSNLTTTLNKTYNTGSVSNINSTAGGIIGYQKSGDLGTTETNIEGSSNKGDVTSNKGSTGGIIGFNSSGTGLNTTTISKSHNTGTLTSTNGYSGGIIGESINNVTVIITDVYNTGDISGDNKTGSNYAGGIIGYNNSNTNTTTIKLTFNMGNVESKVTGNSSGRTNAGGIIGHQESNASSPNVNNIENVYNIGTISSALISGGIVGINANVKTKIDTSFNYSDVKGSTKGAIIGSATGGSNTYTNNFWYATNSSNKPTAVQSAGAELSFDNFINDTSFPTWDFTNTWEILPGAKYPTLKSNKEPVEATE